MPVHNTTSIQSGFWCKSGTPVIPFLATHGHSRGLNAVLHLPCPRVQTPPNSNLERLIYKGNLRKRQLERSLAIEHNSRQIKVLQRHTSGHGHMPAAPLAALQQPLGQTGSRGYAHLSQTRVSPSNGMAGATVHACALPTKSFSRRFPRTSPPLPQSHTTGTSSANATRTTPRADRASTGRAGPLRDPFRARAGGVSAPQWHACGRRTGYHGGLPHATTLASWRHGIV